MHNSHILEKLNLQEIVNGKIALKLISNKFLREKYRLFLISNQVTKRLTLKMV